MANSLGRNIAEGELIVLDMNMVRPAFNDIQHRILVAKSGFGMSNFTAGTAIYAVDLFDRTEFRWHSFDLNQTDTDNLHAAIDCAELWRPENAAALLEMTDHAPWAKDVVHAAEIWRLQEMALRATEAK